MDLKNIRTKAKLSGEAVSKRAGITPQHYNYIENGKRRPSVEVAKRIAAVLGFPWTRFYEEDDGGAAGASGRADVGQETPSAVANERG